MHMDGIWKERRCRWKSAVGNPASVPRAAARRGAAGLKSCTGEFGLFAAENRRRQGDFDHPGLGDDSLLATDDPLNSTSETNNTLCSLIVF